MEQSNQPLSQVPTVFNPEEQPLEDFNSVVLYDRKVTDSLSLYNTSSEIEEAVKRLPDNVQNIARNHFYESTLWTIIKFTPTPLEVIKYREGADKTEFEYVDEYYITSELDRLFPGWWMEDCKTDYISEIKSFVTTGYVFVQYHLPDGTSKIRKIYGVGSKEVQGKKNAPNLPSQPDFVAKASLTDFLKNVGKRYGIALDIYHQKITSELRSYFEDWLRLVPPQFHPNFTAIAGSIKTGKGFRKYLRELATTAQLQRMARCIEKVEPSKRDVFWNEFFKLNNKTEENSKQLEKWLVSFESAINKSKQGVPNGSV